MRLPTHLTQRDKGLAHEPKAFGNGHIFIKREKKRNTAHNCDFVSQLIISKKGCKMEFNQSALFFQTILIIGMQNFLNTQIKPGGKKKQS